MIKKIINFKFKFKIKIKYFDLNVLFEFIFVNQLKY